MPGDDGLGHDRRTPVGPRRQVVVVAPRPLVVPFGDLTRIARALMQPVANGDSVGIHWSSVSCGLPRGLGPFDERARLGTLPDLPTGYLVSQASRRFAALMVVAALSASVT